MRRGIAWCALAIAPLAQAVELQMRNVNFRVAKDIVLEVTALRGRLKPIKKVTPVTFDDPESFVVEIDAGEMAITTESLTALLNSYTFAYEGAPLKRVSAEIRGDRLILKGTLHKGVDLPFEIDGALSATPEGEIRVHADKIKSAHIPFKGLLHLLGEDLSKLINQNAGRGAKISGDDILLAPIGLTPPPHLDGRVTQAAIDGGKLVAHFESGRHPAALNPPLKSAAYIYHRGGVLRFGKLTMNDADMEIVGDAAGKFDFFQREYKKQLVPGYSKNTPANGLIVHMVDYTRTAARGKRLPVPRS